MNWLRYLLLLLVRQPPPLGWTPGLQCQPAGDAALPGEFWPRLRSQQACETMCTGPAEGPEPRTDNWGLGWLNFQALLAAEMLSADLSEVTQFQKQVVTSRHEPKLIESDQHRAMTLFSMATLSPRTGGGPLEAFCTLWDTRSCRCTTSTSLQDTAPP